MPVSPTRDHIRGQRSAPVMLVEYGDYECPHCGQAHPIVQELLAQAGDVVSLCYRNFPLSQIHPHAFRAAEAAEAAGAQGRFWEMHDTLFENQDALEDEDLVAYAADLGLDLGRFQVELVKGVHAPRVHEDFASGVRSGVNGTPTFFVNGRRHDGPWDLDSLTAAIAAAMSAHGRGHGRGPEHDRPYA
jgi:protein-disulfide isomerase